MSIFGREPIADVVPFLKRRAGLLYCIFVPQAAFGSSYYGLDRQRAFATTLMNQHLTEEEISALSEVDLSMGIETGGAVWCDTLTTGEATDYLALLGLRFQLIEQVYRVPEELVREKSDLIERAVMERVYRRHGKAERRRT